MPKAIELLLEGRKEELWQMCCGFTELSLPEFMTIQRRLLLEQIELLNRSAIGNKIMRGVKPTTIEEFRKRAPLTTYSDYLPELLEKREDALPVKPYMWVHTSGRSGEYPCKWVPLTYDFAMEMSRVMYGVGIFSACKERGDVSQMRGCPKIVYTVAPRPYMSGAMAALLELQTPADYLPPLDEAEKMSFEERIKLGFKQALSQGFDYFFGMSLVLAAVGDRLTQPSSKVNIMSLLAQPKALARLLKGVVKSKLARRPMLPKDLWSVRGIMCGGLDSWVYRDKIKRLWGRYPLDVYASTEGGVMATQTWDFDSMTFVPSLNFLEFIPEEEQFKWELDHSYKPETLLLDEVKPGENYELVITNFHGGAMVRYRIGDMIKITSLRNEKLGIGIPQMVFERRVDGLLDFNVIRLTEKSIWQAIEKAGIQYEDWAAYKEPGQMVLHLLIEPKNGYRRTEKEVAEAVYGQIIRADTGEFDSAVHKDALDMVRFSLEVDLLPPESFARFTAKRRAEGADLAHLKPPHINPSTEILAVLTAKSEEAGTSGGTAKVTMR